MTQCITHHHRRGLATVVILVLLAMTLGVAYTVLRSQATSAQLQSNSGLDSLSRQAAVTGYAIALRKMNEANWSITNTVSGTMSSNQSYAVTYVTGDPTLTTSGTNASDWPWRVTITSVGKATDPARPTVVATHTVQAVVKLVARQTPTLPTTLTTALSYTVYQTGNDDFELQLPCRVTGAVRLQGQLHLCDSYPPSSYGMTQYLIDLSTMRTAGYGDLRPLNGPVYIPSNKINSQTLSALVSNLGVTCTYISSTSATGWNFPGAIASYQLYPGGQTFSAQSLSSNISNTSLTADPRTNPLGFFYRTSALTIGSNVAVSGTIFCSSSVTISGTNVSMQPATLPTLMSTTQSLQFPAVVVSGSLYVKSAAQASISGLVATWGAVDVLPGADSTTLSLQGRVVCNGFQIEERTSWTNTSSFLWSWYWALFNSQNSTPYYPVWLNAIGLTMTPSLTIVPETSSVNYRWKDATNSLFIANSSDPGLVWSVVNWIETF